MIHCDYVEGAPPKKKKKKKNNKNKNKKQQKTKQKKQLIKTQKQSNKRKQNWNPAEQFYNRHFSIDFIKTCWAYCQGFEWHSHEKNKDIVNRMIKNVLYVILSWWEGFRASP